MKANGTPCPMCGHPVADWAAVRAARKKDRPKRTTTRIVRPPTPPGQPFAWYRAELPKGDAA